MSPVILAALEALLLCCSNSSI